MNESLDRKLVIGLIGMQLAGKGTFSTLLKKFVAANPPASGSCEVEVLSSGELLAKILAAVRASKTRVHMQNLAAELRRTFGDVITEAMRKKILASKADIVVFDGVRWPSDVKMIREFPLHLNIYIFASQQTRYERMKLRKEKVGEDVATWEQFLVEDSAETEIDIPMIGVAAEMRMENEGTPQEFEYQAENVYHKLLFPRL